MKTRILNIIPIGIRTQRLIKFPILLLLVFLSFLPSIPLHAGDKLLNYAVLGSANLSKNEITPSFGGLINIKIKGNLRIESGYRFDIFRESNKAELLKITNTVTYHTIPLGLSYTYNNVDFVLGTSFHFTGNADLEIDRVYVDYEGRESLSQLDFLDITDEYQKMFCAVFCNIRYNFGGYYGIGASYEYGVTDRLANAIFKRSFQCFSLNFYVRLNENLLY